MGFIQKLFARRKVLHARPADLEMQRIAFSGNSDDSCGCLQSVNSDVGNTEPQLHTEIQNIECEGWKLMLSLVHKAEIEKCQEFAPGLEFSPALWSQIITLPPSIARLKSVKKLYLYGSHLVRVPPEIGEMVNLEEFDAYRSYRLHWLPFEISRCAKLKRSRLSTRALYGNRKYRPPFPRLGVEAVNLGEAPVNCSVCNQSLPGNKSLQVWISLRIATDVMPLMVNACSKECIGRLPTPEQGYVDHPHCGGLELKQPPR